jgi:hypothetical protein
MCWHQSLDLAMSRNPYDYFVKEALISDLSCVLFNKPHHRSADVGASPIQPYNSESGRHSPGLQLV